MRIPHKGKNKGKYISFHYLRGWKARKIRKVQEISHKFRFIKFFKLPFYPSSLQTIPVDCHCIIGENAVIGENAKIGVEKEGEDKGVATIGPGVYVGDGATVGSNAMVRENVKDGEEEW